MLLTKKRYVGDMYESRGQTEPVLDCKGIEIVRRDTCPLVAKTFEAALKLLFRTKDLSGVKRYLVRQWTKVFYATRRQAPGFPACVVCVRKSVWPFANAKAQRLIYVPVFWSACLTGCVLAFFPFPFVVVCAFLCCGQVLEDRLPLQEFVFAKEVRLGTYARESSLPPAAVVASRMMIEVGVGVLVMC